MVLQDKLYTVLSDGDWHSGEVLAKKFNKSRTAIWKGIKQLQAAGLDIESLTGKGYKLQSAVPLFNYEKITTLLSDYAASKINTIDIMRQVDSTNDVCHRRLANTKISSKDCSGYIVLAEQQTAGRGRRGRMWVSPFGANVYMSLIWTFTQGVGALSGLSLVVGLAVIKSLENQGYEGLDLKWPNDILWHGNKLAGILLEITGDVAGSCNTVIGIGVNLHMPSLAAKDISQAWTDLSAVNKGTSKNKVLQEKNVLTAMIINQLVEDIIKFQQNGFAAFRDQWLSRDAYLMKQVCLTLGPKNTVTGKYIDISDNGSIIIDTPKGVETFGGGEVSLRLDS